MKTIRMWDGSQQKKKKESSNAVFGGELKSQMFSLKKASHGDLDVLCDILNTTKFQHLQVASAVTFFFLNNVSILLSSVP